MLTVVVGRLNKSRFGLIKVENGRQACEQLSEKMSIRTTPLVGLVIDMCGSSIYQDLKYMSKVGNQNGLNIILVVETVTKEMYEFADVVIDTI